MPDYSAGKIYRIILENDNRIYIGSTVNSLARRMTGHRDTFNKWANGEHINYCSSFDLFLDGTPSIELVELFPCSTRKELHKREGEIIRSTENCINTLVAGRGYKEWYEQNKSIVLEKNRAYREKNKEKISQFNKEYRDKNSQKIKQYQTNYAKENRIKKREYDAARRIEKRDEINQRQRENYAKRKATTQA